MPELTSSLLAPIPRYEDWTVVIVLECRHSFFLREVLTSPFLNQWLVRGAWCHYCRGHRRLMWWGQKC